MAWFSRPARVPDPLLGTLTVDQAEQLRSLALHAWTEAGFPSPDVQGDRVVDGTGAVYGLGNLAALVAALPRRQWAAAVRHHADTLAEMDSAREPQTFDEVRGLVVARIVHVEDLPDPDATGAGPALAANLVVRAALDLPTHVQILHDGARYGGWAVTGPTALANLGRLPAPEHTTHDAGDGAVVHCFFAEDFFGASRLLLLDELLASQAGIERPEHGVLVAVPHRHLVAVHVLQDASAARAVGALIGLAQGGRDAAGSLSADVYYRSPDGAMQVVTDVDPDGGTRVVVDGPFGDAMARLGLVG
ncbi:hypothetical protein [Cellulomonas sp. PhB150]|uniref:hypothetical protein n=1 Tax=Cellulomonas sp. PhB150 TaxID=2485188 RepID=UPI000FA95E0F|nr:hypothetical protein [Cellulomonas sp. PhB150]ROS31486.1 hypothetical protein EDF34_1145 [Cellulomonas sp. PhB150]